MTSPPPSENVVDADACGADPTDEQRATLVRSPTWILMVTAS